MFAVNARNSLKSLAVSSDSESEVEPFITQTKAASVAVLQLSFSEKPETQKLVARHVFECFKIRKEKKDKY